MLALLAFAISISAGGLFAALGEAREGPVYRWSSYALPSSKGARLAIARRPAAAARR